MAVKAWTFALLAAPGVLLGATGMTHPNGLNPDSAEHWFWMHVVGVVVFPLVGVALAWLVRSRRDPLAIAVIVAAYVYATFYTALDVISGIGNGYATWQLGDAAVPRPASISLAFKIGTMLGDIGAVALLIAAVLLTIDEFQQRPVVLSASVVACGLVTVGSYLVREEHIFWPWGALSCIAIGLGTGWLGVLRDSGPANRGLEGAHGVR